MFMYMQGAWEGGQKNSTCSAVFYFYMAAGVCWFFGVFFLRGWGKPLELYLPWPREALRGHW